MQKIQILKFFKERQPYEICEYAGKFLWHIYTKYIYYLLIFSICVLELFMA